VQNFNTIRSEIFVQSDGQTSRVRRLLWLLPLAKLTMRQLIYFTGISANIINI